jgi:hypothetical protein
MHCENLILFILIIIHLFENIFILFLLHLRMCYATNANKFYNIAIIKMCSIFNTNIFEEYELVASNIFLSNIEISLLTNINENEYKRDPITNSSGLANGIVTPKGFKDDVTCYRETT